MDCAKSRELMMAEFDGELSEAERAPLYGHIEGCESCRGELGALAGLKEGYALLSAEPPPGGFSASWRKAVKSVRPQSKSPIKWISLAASLILLAGVAAISARGVEPPVAEPIQSVEESAQSPEAKATITPALMPFAAVIQTDAPETEAPPSVVYLEEPAPEAQDIDSGDAASSRKAIVDAVITVPDDAVPMITSCLPEAQSAAAGPDGDTPVCVAPALGYRVRLGAESAKLVEYAQELSEKQQEFERFFTKRDGYFELVMTPDEAAEFEELMLTLGAQFEPVDHDGENVLMQVELLS